MLRYVEIVAASWPIAAMFGMACALAGGLAIIRYRRVTQREQIQYRAEQARAATPALIRTHADD